MEDSNKFDINSFVKPFDYATQRAETADLLGRYGTAATQNREKYARAEGLGTINQSILGNQQAMQNLNNLINNMNTTVGQTTGNSMVTQGQRANLVAANIAPLKENLTTLTGQGELLNTAKTAAEANVAAKTAQSLLPFEKEFTTLQTQQAREFTGYTTANQLELDRLLANQQAGLTWTNAEAERANELALAEKQYKAALEQIKEQGDQARQTKKALPDLATLYSSIYG